MPIAMAVECRQILRNGSSRFSKEPALAETKHLRSASSDLGFANSSSTRAVSSCSLTRGYQPTCLGSGNRKERTHHDRIDSRALTWK
jgi:hypothetical protein